MELLQWHRARRFVHHFFNQECRLPSYLIIFVGTLVSVLAVGVEMRAISRRQIGLAAGSAAIIAGGQLVAMRLVPGSTDWLDYVSYIAANFLGIWISFSLYGVFQKRTFEFPLHICEGKVQCPFKAGACTRDLDQCPAMISFFQAGKALERKLN